MQCATWRARQSNHNHYSNWHGGGARDSRSEATDTTANPSCHETVQRQPMSSAGWTEVFVNHKQAGSFSAADALAHGHSILVVTDFAATAECTVLLAEARFACQETCLPAHARCHFGRVRMPVHRLAGSARRVSDALLLRALERVDAKLPSLTQARNSRIEPSPPRNPVPHMLLAPHTRAP